jgi:hypothetical protein
MAHSPAQGGLLCLYLIWLMPIILATREAEIKRIEIQGLPGQIVPRLYLENIQHKKVLAE